MREAAKSIDIGPPPLALVWRVKGKHIVDKPRVMSLAAAYGLPVLLLAAVLLGVGDGAVKIAPTQVAAILAQKIGLALPFEFTAQQAAVLWAIRLPRVLLGLLAGGGLAVSGALMQGLFRNPLAEPTLIGVSGGAALAAVTVIVLGESFAAYLLASYRLLALPLAAFAGGLGTTFLVHKLGRQAGRGDTATILLAGVGVNALAFAGIGALSFLATDAQLRSISFWNLGSLSGATWSNLAVVAPLAGLPLLLAGRLARRLNALLLGEAEAAHLGVNSERLKTQIVALAALMVGVCVAFTGVIGFVGLVVPHLLRLLLGADHRRLLPASAWLGASLLIAADWLSRTLFAPAELPLGVVTALLGAPFFLWLLLRGAREF